MNVVIAPDSFKGSLSAKEISLIMKKSCLDVFPDAEVILKPMADGGEGTLDSLLFTTKGKRLHIPCTGPLGEKIKAPVGILGDGKTAVIEVASVSGITQVPEHKRNPYRTTTYGIGQCIQFVLDQGLRNIVIGLGGSATNDGGMGMLSALGAQFFSEDSEKPGMFGYDLLKIARVDLSRLDERLRHTRILIASDVRNPLCGQQGASHVYGPQKGATRDQVLQLDRALDRYSNLLEKQTGIQAKHTPGAGAAGGLGFALLSLGAKIESGAELIASYSHLEETVAGADLVLTGEGQSDRQTFYGKAPGYVAQLCKKYGVPSILLSGGIEGEMKDFHQWFTACFSLVNRPMSLTESMEHAESLLYDQSLNIFHLIKSMNRGEKR